MTIFGKKEEPQPFFACTFKCPVCGSEMQYEHRGCEAKHALLISENSHLQLALHDIKEAYARRHYEKALAAGEQDGLNNAVRKAAVEVMRSRPPYFPFPDRL